MDVMGMLSTLPDGVNGTMQSVDSSLRDRIGWGAGNLFGSLGADKHLQRYAANKIGGAIDLVPGIGDAVGVDDAYQDYKSGNLGMAAAGLGLAAMGAIPGVGDVAKKGAQELMDRASQKGIDLVLSASPGRVRVNKIVVPAERRGRGAGSEMMKEIIEFADNNGVTLSLDPSADFGGNKKRLEKFYKSLGFESNIGRKRDFEITESMRRYPKPSR